MALGAAAIASIITAAIAAASSTAQGVRAKKSADKRNEELDKMKSENIAWYQRRYNEDPTQRADAQRLLRITEDKIRRSNEAAAGTQAVVGGSEASVAATKEANAKALSDTMSDIAAQNESRKDQVENKYRERSQSLSDKSLAIEQDKDDKITNAISQGMQGIGQAAGAISDMPSQIHKSKVNTSAAATQSAQKSVSPYTNVQSSPDIKSDSQPRYDNELDNARAKRGYI